MSSARKTSKPNILERLRDSWVEYLHIIYILIVFGGYFAANFMDLHEFKTRAALIAILVYMAIILVSLGYFIHAYSRKARYAEALSCVHNSVHGIRDAAEYLKACYYRKDRYEQSRFRQQLQQCLDSIARGYTLAVGTQCRASIKLIGGNTTNTSYVRTLARDSSSAERCIERDQQEGETHQIVQNTDYSLIMYSGKQFFLSNDLSVAHNYTNTSDRTYTNGRPYKSTIVLPIKHKSVRYETDGKCEVENKILGFLTIDSSSRYCFAERYDVEMGYIVSDALYPVLDLWKRIVTPRKKVGASK